MAMCSLLVTILFLCKTKSFVLSVLFVQTSTSASSREGSTTAARVVLTHKEVTIAHARTAFRSVPMAGYAEVQIPCIRFSTKLITLGTAVIHIFKKRKNS